MDPASFLETFDRRVAAFWTYWASLPRAGAAPHLRDYLDRVPPDLQPSVLISDFYAADRNELRLIGTVMAEVMGVDTDETSLGQVYDRPS